MTERPRVLCVEDDDGLRSLMLDIALDSGFEASAAATAEAALVCAADTRVDVLVTDVLLPAMSGIDLMTRMRSLHPGLSVIVISGQATVDMAVTAMKRGALDFLTKPFSPQGLRTLLRLAAARSPAVGAAVDAPAPPILGNSVAMREVLDQIDRIAPFSTSVLIAGETGTGKELVAQRLHAHSPRASKSFVALNCAAVPEQLLEDELFGHVRGAFTGAQDARTGRFEQAHEGTLFLDEIGDMSLPLQAKLLRVLQARQFERLGSNRTIHVDVRVVAATSADLEDRIRTGTFRADLYYRLNVIRLVLPPLRARGDDISLLAQALLDASCTELGLPHKQLAPATLAVLMRYGWPGNVRQLRNAMERAAALTGSATVVLPDDLPVEITHGPRHGPTDTVHAPAPAATRPPSAESMPLDDVLRDLERRLLLDALEKTGGNKVQAARLLGVKRTTFAARLRRARRSDK